MKEKERSNKSKFLLVMGLALGLPSTIIGFFFILYQLVENDVISWNTLLVVLLVIIFYMLFLMVKNGLVKKDK